MPLDRKSPSKQTSARLSKIAAKGLRRPERLTLDEIRALCASCLSQDEISREVRVTVEEALKSG